MYPTTLEVADLLGSDYCRLTILIRRRRIPAPAKDSGGRFIWTPAAVAQARKVIEEIDAKRKERQSAEK